jgi:DNA primase
LSTSSYPFFVTPTAERPRDRNRIIIPYYYNKGIVGYTSRYYEGGGPKYISEQQQGYVFNYDGQHRRGNTSILVEGQFDAISIGGCAYLGSTISDEQAKLVSKLNREIIVVPDRDQAGMSICERAFELGYKVSIPEWSTDIKDVNDAVKKYGRLPTLLSILESATSSKITVEMKRRKFK